MRLLSVNVSDKAVVDTINTLVIHTVMECCLFSHDLFGEDAEEITCNWHDGRVTSIVSQI
jgi:hypothetical protein